MLKPTIAGAVCAMNALAPAQTAIPEAHWGACIQPPASHEIRLGLTFNRFTQYSSTGDPSDPGSARFNDTAESAGFNLAVVSWTEPFFAFGTQRLTSTIDIGAGPSDDEPTSFLQNDYIHKALGQNSVPVGSLRDRTDFVCGASVRHWLGDGSAPSGADDRAPRVPWQAYVGAGFGASSIYNETHLQLGGTLLVRDVLKNVHLELGVHDRAGWLYESRDWGEIADFANVAQLGIALVPANFASTSTGTFCEGWDLFWRADTLLPTNWPGLVYDFVGRPKVGVHWTYDTGLFENPRGNSIDTWFLSLRFDWPTGLRIETYNDFANGTDWGPTFGLLVSFDLVVFSRKVFP